jgi:hypothetical protein
METSIHLLQLGLGEVGHGEEPERIVPRQTAISVLGPFPVQVPSNKKTQRHTFVRKTREGIRQGGKRACRVASRNQTFVGEGEPLEVGSALLLEAQLLGRRVRPHLSPRPVHLPPCRSPGRRRRGEGRRRGELANSGLEECHHRKGARGQRLPADVCGARLLQRAANAAPPRLSTAWRLDPATTRASLGLHGGPNL